ncbi:MAG: WG repeat-containing protein, partial [Terriglobia bacterium]
GLAPARPGGKRTKWGYIDKAGKWAIRPQFLQAGPFSEGLAPVRVFTFSFPPFKWGFIDKLWIPWHCNGDSEMIVMGIPK